MYNKMRVYNNPRMVSLPKLEDIQYYIYALENDKGLVKIGISKDISQRVLSLSGSNGGGNYIVRVAVSPTTYLKTLESSLHDMFNKYRVRGTEWFDGISFEEVVIKMDEIFSSSSYERTNEMRKQAGGYK